MAVRVARGGHDRGEPINGDAGERVLPCGRAHCVHRLLHVAGGWVLDSYRHRQPTAELPVHLAGGRASADRAPAHRVGKILRRDRVEKLTAHRQAQREDVCEQRSGDAQAGVDVIAAVQVGVVEEPFPTERGAWLLEVHPHDHAYAFGEFGGKRREPPRVVQCRARIVHRAGTHDHQQSIVGACQDRSAVGAARGDDIGGRIGKRQLLGQQRWGNQRADPGRYGGW